MTIQEAIDWCNRQIGQNSTQSLGFFSLYYQHLTGRNPHADGVPLTSTQSAWEANAAGFTKYYHDPLNANQLPPPGSIIFLGSSIAVVDHADAVSIVVWEEVSGSGVQHVTHTFLDSVILGWLVWNGLPEPLPVKSTTANTSPSPKSGSIYTWVKGDTIWRIAPRFGLQAAELLEHNSITDWHHIRPGDVLHLPIPHPVVSDYELNIEVLDSHRPMHVCRNGTRKLLFGYGKSFDALQLVGPSFVCNTRKTIVATAHVRIRGERRDFYMDAVALGDYAVTGRIRYAIGFKPDDLADGYINNNIARSVLAWAL